MHNGRKALAALTDEIKNSISHMEDLGVKGIDCSEETLKIIDALGRPVINKRKQANLKVPAQDTRSSVAESVSPQIEKPINTLGSIQNELEGCTRCKLYSGRTNLVFGDGNPNADLVFVGEGPGYDEDQSGLPFVGKSGQLLTKIIGAMGLNRDQVYICNIVKCRPPGNRNPEIDEIKTCGPYLLKQLEVIKPKVICALGKFAAQTLLKTDTPISRLRGSFHDFRGIKLMPTYHPSYLLRNPEMKRQTWEDVQQIMKYLELRDPRS